MIARLLRQRARGVERPVVLREAQATRLTFSLTLSGTRSFERSAGRQRGGVTALAVEAGLEGRYALVCRSDKGVTVYDTVQCGDCGMGSGKEFAAVARAACPGAAQHCVAWYPQDSGVFVSSGMDGEVLVWDTNAMQVVDRFDDETIPDHVYRHAVGANCLVAVVGAALDVALCDLRSGSTTHCLQGHRGHVLCVDWCPSNDFLLATGGADGRVLLWDVRSARACLRSLDQHNGGGTAMASGRVTAHDAAVNGLVFSGEGQLLATTGLDNRTRLWRTAFGRNTMVNYPEVSNEYGLPVGLCISTGPGRPVLFQPNGSHIASYELRTGRRIQQLRGHYGRPQLCCLHPSRTELYSASTDAEVLVWTPGVVEQPAHDAALAELQADAWSSDEDEDGDDGGTGGVEAGT